MPKSKLALFHQSAATPAAVWGGIGSAFGGLAVIVAFLGFSYHSLWPRRPPDASHSQATASGGVVLPSAAVRLGQHAVLPDESAKVDREDGVIRLRTKHQRTPLATGHLGRSSRAYTSLETGILPPSQATNYVGTVRSYGQTGGVTAGVIGNVTQNSHDP